MPSKYVKSEESFKILKRQTILAAKDLGYEYVYPHIEERLNECTTEEELSKVMTTARMRVKDY